MSASPVHYDNRDGVGFIVIDYPPLNILSKPVRDGLQAALAQAAADTRAQGYVLTAKGRSFTAGADISEFNGAFDTSDLNAICAALEDLPKPIVAALHGTPLGGGLEIALACHFRIAAPNTRLGLPEVKLGILPGGGGTQRLPRLTGARIALEMIISGEPITADAALTAGIVDEIAQGDLTEAAAAFIKTRAQLGAPVKTRDRGDKIDQDRGSSLFAEKREALAKAKPGQFAPLRCVDAVEAAFALPFDAGLAREADLFAQALQDDQAKALIHAFFAEREAQKIPGLDASVKPREVKSIGIVGFGTMGGGIAMAFVNAGIPVVVIERDEAALVRGRAAVLKNYEGLVKRGRLNQAALDTRLSAITGATSYDALANVDLVIEAAFEDMAVKETVFRELDRVCKRGAILGTNTSTLDIDRIAAATSRPKDVIGLHFFSPAHVMRLLEIVRGAQTAPDVIATALTLGRKIGKVGVVAGNCDGFIGNRMLDKYLTEAMKIVEDGVSPADVDAAVTGFGMAMGPFAMLDLAGIDVSWHIRQRRVKEGKDYASALLDPFYETGRLGQKTGRGFYRYEPGSRTALPDAEADAIVAAYRAKTGAKKVDISQQEIVKRLVYALVNEGANLLDEGIALRSGDIDIVYLYGYGFPAWRGGPMKYAELRGLDEVLADIIMLQTRYGERWRPAQLLKTIVTDGKSKWPR